MVSKGTYIVNQDKVVIIGNKTTHKGEEVTIKARDVVVVVGSQWRDLKVSINNDKYYGTYIASAYGDKYIRLYKRDLNKYLKENPNATYWENIF